jgi:hypothetical protein
MTWSLSLIKRGYDRVAETHQVLSDDMESQLVKHILLASFTGLVASNPKILPRNWHIETSTLSQKTGKEMER